MLIDQKFYTSDGYILMRFQGKKCYHISASCLPENAEPIIRAATGFTGPLQWEYWKWGGVYSLDQTISFSNKEVKNDQ